MSRSRTRGGRGALVAQDARALERLDGRAQRPLANLGGGAPVQRKGGEQTVAHELQDLAAELLDGRHQPVVVAVQRLDQLVARILVGRPGEAAQIRIQDHRRDDVELAAADLAGEDAAPASGPT